MVACLRVSCGQTEDFMGNPLAGAGCQFDGPDRSASPHTEGIGMQVTRKRREVLRFRLGRPRWIGRRLYIAAVVTTALLAAGGGMAFGTTLVFGDNQVGTQYHN